MRGPRIIETGRSELEAPARGYYGTSSCPSTVASWVFETAGGTLVSRRSGLIFVIVALLVAAALALPDGPALSGRGDPRIVIPQLPIAFYVLLARS